MMNVYYTLCRMFTRHWIKSLVKYKKKVKKVVPYLPDTERAVLHGPTFHTDTWHRCSLTKVCIREGSYTSRLFNRRKLFYANMNWVQPAPWLAFVNTIWACETFGGQFLHRIGEHCGIWDHVPFRQITLGWVLLIIIYIWLFGHGCFLLCVVFIIARNFQLHSVLCQITLDKLLQSSVRDVGHLTLTCQFANQVSSNKLFLGL
jgi:hypothetical protein